MDSLEADLAAIEIGLESENYDRVLARLEKLKADKSYEHDRSGYLVDFYMGQAIFRKEMAAQKKPKNLLQARAHLERSIQLQADFADSHILAGYISMVLADHPNYKDSVFHTLDSHYHLTRAKGFRPSISSEISSKISLLEDELSHLPELALCSTHEDMVLEWQIEFERFPWVEIVHDNITKQKGDAIVSPANSFGFMDGGLDYTLSEFLGWELQEKLQQRIQEKHAGELLVGVAEIIETGKAEMPYLISAPTMRVPMDIQDSMNPYLASRAVFLAVERFNSDSARINKVLMPSMGTGVGNVSFSSAARQMRAAYEDVVLQRNKFPSELGDAQQKHKVLSSDHYHKIHNGKY